VPRVVVLNDERKALFVHHNHLIAGGSGQFWVLPGGDIDPGETSPEAAVREVREETGVEVEILRLLWLVEERIPGGLPRSNAFFLGVPVGGSLRVGEDPESPPQSQVIDDARYFGAEETPLLDRIYPEIMRHQFWELLASGQISAERERHPTYRFRPSVGFGR
jgi:8-oxo-dGTP diphosphatase